MATPFRATIFPGAIINGVDFYNFQVTALPDGDDTVYAGDGDDLVYGDNLVADPRIVSTGTRADMLYGEAGEARCRVVMQED